MKTASHDLRGLPETWSTAPLKRMAGIINSGVYGEDEPSHDRPVALRACTTAHIDPVLGFKFDKLEYRYFSHAEAHRYRGEPGDIFVVKSSGSNTNVITGKRAQVETENDLIFTNFLLRARSNHRSHPRFLFHLLGSSLVHERIKREVATTTYPNLNLGQYLGEPLPFPDLATQKSIADFLDRETAHIDQLIEKKQRLVVYVEERRNARISEAVTVGLDPGVELKETNSRYLPRIPESWTVWRLKHLARVRGGITLGRSVPEGEKITSVPYLRVANVQAGWLDLDDITYIDATESEIKRYSLEDGNILMNEGGDNDKLGRGAVWCSEIVPCINQNHVFAVKPNDREQSGWISMATNARYARDFFYLHSNQSTNLASISKTNLERFPVAIPPRQQMLSTLERLQNELQRLHTIRSKTQSSIDRLREFRSAVITAAVTGQIDVTTWGKRGETDRRLDRINEEMPLREARA